MSTEHFNVVELDPIGKNLITFRFDEFNQRRKMRDVEAARVYIDQHDGQGETWLWMSKKDAQANIKEFGPSADLEEVIKAYNGKPYKTRQRVES